MRNTTKLKAILLMYDLDLSMDEDSCMTLTLIDKRNGSIQAFSNASYSTLIAKAYSFMMKELKKN